MGGMRRPRVRHRQTAVGRDAAARAAYLARRIGVALRDSRTALGLRQADVAERAGITQAHVSRIERGVVHASTLRSLTACAAALDVQLAAFVEARPGATLPRDHAHLRRQALVIATAAPGGWRGEPEALVQVGGGHPRSVDVLLTREARRECTVTEIWDLMPDVGDAMRGLEAKVDAVRQRLGPGWRVAGLLVVRGTRRNRALVARFAPLFRARYPASSAAWLRCLADPAIPMPEQAGFLWTDVAGDALRAARLG